MPKGACCTTHVAGEIDLSPPSVLRWTDASAPRIGAHAFGGADTGRSCRRTYEVRDEYESWALDRFGNSKRQAATLAGAYGGLPLEFESPRIHPDQGSERIDVVDRIIGGKNGQC